MQHWGCGNKMAVSQAGVCRTTHVPRSRGLASTLGESKILGAGVGRVCVCASVAGVGAGQRDERTMTCMQVCFVSLSLPPTVYPARPIRPPASFCFALGPVHRVPRHWPALWICCHTSDDMLDECGPPAAAHWPARERDVGLMIFNVPCEAGRTQQQVVAAAAAANARMLDRHA